MNKRLWEQWHISYSDSVRNFCFSRLTEGDMQAADALAAIAIERGVIAASRSPKDVGNISGYLIRIATNEFLDQRRAGLAHEHDVMISGDISDLDLPSREMGVEDQLHYKALKEKISDAISVLQPSFERIARARFIDEMSYEEIAQLYKISIGTVKSSLSRSKELLRDLI